MSTADVYFCCAGNWYHVGYHLTTSIAAPALLSLPFAFAALGWFVGLICLIVRAGITFYSYNLISLVLEHLESKDNRHLHFRDMAKDILDILFIDHGPLLIFYSYFMEFSSIK